MAMPYSVRVAIDSFREEEPTFSTLSDEQIYKHLKTYEPHLEWKEADKTPAKTRRKKDSSPSYMNAFAEWFDYGINEQSSDWMKAAYNNSLTGMTEQLMKGEQRYDLKDYDPNILADIGSMALSFLMPLDLLTFGAGGKFVGQPLAKMATAGMKSRVGAKFGTRALDAMIPAAINQAGTLATYEGAMGGVLAGIENENVMEGIGKGVLHGSIMGGAAGLVGGGLAFKNANVLKALSKEGKIAKAGQEATKKLTSYDKALMRATGMPGQIVGESATFTAGETLETAIDPDRDVRLEDIITSLGKNIGLFSILKGKSKLLQRGKEHVKLLEEQEVLKNVTDGLNKKKTRESEVYHNTYDRLMEEKAAETDPRIKERIQKDADTIKAEASNIDKGHFENRDAYKELIDILDLMSDPKKPVEPSVENYTKIVTGLEALIEAENRLGKTGAYKALTSQMERTKKEANDILDNLNERLINEAEKIESTEEKQIRLQAEAQERGVKDISIGKKKIAIEEATPAQIEARLKPLREKEQKQIELAAAEAGLPSADIIAERTAKKMGQLNPIDAFKEQGLSTKVEISELKAGSGKHAKANKYVGKKAHELINEAKIADSTKKKIYLGVKEFFPQSRGKMAHLSEVLKYAEYLEKIGIKFDDSRASHFKKYLKTTGQWENRKSIAGRLQKFYGGTHDTSWGLITQGQGYAGKYMRIGVGLANVGVLDVRWGAIVPGKATRITSTQKGLMSEVMEYLPEKINLDKKAPEIPNIVKKPIAKKTVQSLFETFYRFPKRISEMIGLKVGDINVKNGTVKFNVTKGKKGDTIVETFDLKTLDPVLWDTVVSLRKNKAKGDYIFSDMGKKKFSNDTVNGILDFLIKESGVTPVSMRGGKKFTSHHFRHSAATDAETIFRESGGKKDYVDLVQQILLSHEPDKLTRTHYIDKKAVDVNKELAEFYAAREGIEKSTKKDADIAVDRIKIAEKVKKTSKEQVESIAAEMQTSAVELGEQVKYFKKKFPQLTITLKKTLGKYRGEYVLGRITGHAVEIAKGRAGADTIPHEVAHHVVDVLRQFGDAGSKKLIRKGERLFGGEEKLVQAVGEYGAGRLRNRSMVSKAKAWVQEFWSNMRAKLGWYTEADITRVLGKKLMTGKIPTGEIAEFKAKYQTKGDAIKEKKDLNRQINSQIRKINIPTPILREAKEAIFGTENLSKYTEWANVHQMREFNEFVHNPKNWHVNKVEQLNAKYAINPEVSKQHLRDMGVKGGIPENATLHTIKEYQSFIKENYTKSVIHDNTHDWILNLKDTKYTAAKVLGRAITPVWLVLKNHGGKPGRKISEKLLNHEWAEHVLYKGPGDQAIHLIKKTLGKDKQYTHLFDIERTEARLKRKKGDEDYTKEGEMSVEDKRFYKNMFKKGTPEYEAYNTWTNKENNGYADFTWDTLFKELSEHHNPSEIAKLKRELDSKRVEGYMTRLWTKRALETIKEDSPWMDKMVTRNLSEAARREAEIWGQNKSREEISNKRRELEKSEEFKDSIREELYDAMRFGYATVKNPHLIERGALMPEYIEVTNENGRLEKVKVYEDGIGSAEAYVSRMSKFLSTVRYFPEWTGLGSKYKLGESKRLQVEALETDETVGAYAALAIKRQLGVDRTHMESLNRPMYKGLAWFTNLSAAVGLSSPLSGVKNLMIGQPRTAGHFGFRNTMRAWARGFDSIVKADARTKGQLEYGSKSLELERIRLGEEGAWRNVKMSKLFKFNLMTQTENMNRIVSSHAGQLYFGEVLSKLRGEKGMFKMGTNKGRMRRVMSEVWHLTPEEIRLLETTKNLNTNEIAPKYAEIMHKVGHFSHVSTQGGTSTVLLPLWMSSREGRPLTLFQRMATSTTIDSYRNFVKPVLDYGNVAPILRATMGHALSGGALFFMYKTLLSKEPPVGSKLEQDDGWDRVMMNLWRSEFLGVFGEILSPYDKTIAGSLAEPMIIRHLSEAKDNVHNLLTGGKTFKQAVGDYLKNTVVVAGQVGEFVQKSRSPYYAKFKNARSWTSKWKMEKGMSKYSPDGISTRRQSSYRDLRDAILFGSEEDIALNYWSAFNTIVTDYEVKNPRSSKAWREKQAKTAIKQMINHFNPLNISDSMQGTPHTMRKEFLGWLTPENRKAILEVEKDYYYKIRKYNRYINKAKWRNRYYTYV